LGLSDDPHNARTLVRLVDHRGRTRRDHPFGGAASLGRGPGAEVAVASSADAMSANDAMVYLKPASIFSLPPPPKLPVPALGEISGMSWEPSAYKIASPRDTSTLRTQEPVALNSCRQQDPPQKPDALSSSTRVRSQTPLLLSNLDRRPGSARQAAPEGEQSWSFADNEEFAKLLPSWRAKLRDVSPPARLDAARRWRAQM